MAEDDTQAFDPLADDDGPPWLANRDEDHFGPDELDRAVDEIRAGKTPEPILVRAALMTGVGILGYILGKQLDTSWVEPLVGLYAVAAPAILGLWARRHVTPVKK